MINIRLQKNRFTLTLPALLIIFLISACSNEDILTATNPGISTDSNTDINTETTTNNTALISGIDSASVTEDVDPDGDNLLEAGGRLNITDSDAGEAAFSAKVVNGNYGRLTINATGYWNYAANNNQAAIQNLASGATLTDRLSINSVDGTAHTVAITILGADESNTPADITLSWVAPAEREDNSALSLSAIAGYKVYYGTTQGQYSNSVAINDGTAVAYTFTGLPAGNNYFVLTTIDTEGRESQYSSVVTIII
jgi:VCBS repeat-containing protein